MQLLSTSTTSNFRALAKASITVKAGAKLLESNYPRTIKSFKQIRRLGLTLEVNK
jgi:hypothetical protein